MKKIVISCLAALAAIFLAGGLAACGEKKEGEHLWNTEWKSNAQFHWHNCLNEGCNERDAMLPHEEWTLIDIIDEPTCNERGKGLYACADCGYTKEDIIEATGEHKFDLSSQWLINEQGHYRICTYEGCVAQDFHEHVAASSPRIVKPADSYTKGERTFHCRDCEYLMLREYIPALEVPTTIKFRVKLGEGSWAKDDELLFSTENLPKGVNAEVYLPYTYREGIAYKSFHLTLEYYDAYNGDGRPLNNLKFTYNDSHPMKCAVRLLSRPDQRWPIYSPSYNNSGVAGLLHCINLDLYADDDMGEDAYMGVGYDLDEPIYVFLIHTVSYSRYREILAEKRGTETTALPISEIDLYFDVSERRRLSEQ